MLLAQGHSREAPPEVIKVTLTFQFLLELHTFPDNFLQVFRSFAKISNSNFAKSRLDMMNNIIANDL